MYLQHFNLAKEPFSLLPDSKFLLKLNNCGSLFNELIQFVNSDQSICIVQGSTGIGKSTLCRKLLKAMKLHKRYFVIDINHPNLGKSELYQLLCEQLGLPPSAPKAKKRVRTALQTLVDSNRHTAIVIDNAEIIPDKTLQTLLKLTNREHKGKKLLKAVFFNNTEVESAVDNWTKTTQEADNVRFLELLALDKTDTSQFIEQRLRIAGSDAPELFCPNAVELIAQAGCGRPRLINTLAHKAMITAYQQDTLFIDSKIVDQAIRDTDCMPNRPKPSLLRSLSQRLSRPFANR